ncbi:hypothetical protein BBJ29_000587 [Phytophthora kernoviae]|uniref:RRM domain-containing protein n=1 Tax=Phytophthora kernoviae TaxID=325452 RepID=A0A3F2RZZ7_9STRA|nr:hypothetical protein BBJ29_000587 [Phytophthora kernoviae]RLN67611.1 hypothetical protein BBP00_00001526 [Phytophthora kernoviae]
MGRKPSNVYDYFNRLEPIDGKGLVRYECKKCQKQYASNATRLADHLKQSGCSPSFQSNQRSSSSSSSTVSANMAATAASLAVSTPSAGYGTTPSSSHSLALKKTDHQLLTGMLDSDISTITDTDLLLRLAKLSTCAIADAMADMKIQGHLVDVDLVRGYHAPLDVSICGPALTVKAMPVNGPVVKKLPFNYVDTAEMGQVFVISAPVGSTSAVFGGLLATASKARNVAGVVTDGRVRDVQELCSMNFPAFAKGTSVHGQRGATTVVDVGCPVVISGCVVRNADIIRGDVNGVIVIPSERANEIALKAEIIEDQDNKIADAVQQEEEEEVRTTTTKRDSGRRVVKGRGTGSAAMDTARYPAESGVFEKLKTSSSSRDHSTALRSVEGWLLFVRGVHEEAQEEDVMDAFGEDAQVKDLHLNLDRRSGFVKGYALVEFEHFEDAKAAMERMDGQEILGSTIHVDWAFQKEAERRGGGRRAANRR